MSGKHKAYGTKVHTRQRNGNFDAKPYTTTELRDFTKKAGENLDNIYKLFWAKKPRIGEVVSINNELEVKFSTIKKCNQTHKWNRSKVQDITRNDYDNVVSKLRSLGFTTASDVGTYLLRVQNEIIDDQGTMTLMNPRTEIRGISAIQDYCIHNDINKLLNSPTYSDSVSMENKKDMIHPDTKKKVEEAIFHDFHFSVALKTEEQYNIKSPHGITKAILDDWMKSKKQFRYINRVTFTHPDYPVRIDMSIVKNPKRPNSNSFVRDYTTAEAGVFQANETYEIEIEVDNMLIGMGTDTETMEELIEKVRTCTKFVLMGLQETSFPVSVSERVDVGVEYLRLIGHSPYMQLSSQSHWVGPSSHTLQIGNIVDNKSPDYNSTLINVRDNYTVTDKADGERRLFFITSSGQVYLINSNMKLLFTGAMTTNKLFYNSLLDGEIIAHDKHGKFINLFAAFDVYFVNGKDVRSHVFFREITAENDENDRHRNKSRHHILTHMLKNLNLVSVVMDTETQQPKSSPIRVSVKQFYATTDTVSIFAGCKKILDRIDNGLFEYTTDGLIFTPSNLGVGGEEVGKVGPLKKYTWPRSFKWKPAVFNTVDFLVSVNKGTDGKPMIKTLYDGGMDVGRASQVKSYKTLTLMCGFNDVIKQDRKDTNVYMNPCQDVYDDVLQHSNKPTEKTEKEDNQIPTSGYRPMQFFPSDPYDANGGVCNIILRTDGNGDEQMYTEENEVFGDKTIVEFRYDISNDSKWRWIPLRVRYDKTTEMRTTHKGFGNSYQVANSNWRSIHYPITEVMLKSGLNIPNVDDGVYYNTMKQDRTTNALCNFHNLYVKKMLITKVSRPDDTLIDVACGKGGDFSKWTDARLSFVFGIDLSKDNIENQINGACARYLNKKKTMKSMPSALFVIGNSKFNIRSGNAMETEKAKQITASVFGTSPKNASLGKGVEKHYGIGENGFNVTSCQFALHYFFEDDDILHRFIRNVAECTKVGGYFIGTCYDGKRIFNMLKGKNKTDEIELYNKKTKLWGITKMYDEETFDDDHTSVGYKINVFQETINKEAYEYLVNFEYLTRVMENYGFQVLTDIDAQNLGLPSGCGLFEDLYHQMISSNENRYISACTMSDKEKEISFKNRYFVFKKIITVDLDKIATNKPSEEENVDYDIEDEEQVAEIDNDDPIEVEEQPTSLEEVEEKPVEVKKKKTIKIRKPTKLNQTMVLDGSSDN